MAYKVYVIAEVRDDLHYAIGPFEDVGSKVSDVKDAVEDMGWTSRGTVQALSLADFNRMRKSQEASK